MQRGFSLIELLTVIALIGILSGLAVPAYRSTLISNSLAASSNDLSAAISLARSEAIKRRVRMDVAPIGGDWARGWQVLPNGGAAGTEVRRYDLPGTMTVSNGPAAIGFNPRGLRADFTDINIRLSRDDGKYRRCISVSPSGATRISTEQSGCAA